MDGDAASPPPLPPGLISNPSESHQVNVIVCVMLAWLIGAVFVALRFYVRGCLLQNAIGVEDWLIVVALVFSGATSAGIIERERFCFPHRSKSIWENTDSRANQRRSTAWAGTSSTSTRPR